MTSRIIAWLPGALLAFGALFTVGIDGQRALDLRAPLGSAVPAEIGGQHSKDIPVSKAEQRVAGMSSYVLRVYSPGGDKVDQTAGSFSVYVGYYRQQMRGRTIHSPKNCLPGSGWEALTSTTAAVSTPTGSVDVNRYVLQRGKQRALVLYWYQGRGRVEANEYKVKWNLLRDAALMRRSDEALVRIVVPIEGPGDNAFAQAAQVAGILVPAVERALPARELSSPRLSSGR